MAIHMNKLEIFFNKPIYAGFCILEMSKHVMYNFVYEYLKPKFGEKLTVCGGDTDSLFLEVKTDDFYQDIKPDINNWFDTSDLPENNIFGLESVNKKVLGKFKIETNDKIIKEFIGLRPKMYYVDIQNDKPKTAQKGIVKHKMIKDPNYFKKVLFQNEQHFFNFSRIGSKKLTVETINQEKVGLVNFDDKRFILDDGINTLAYGYEQF